RPRGPAARTPEEDDERRSRQPRCVAAGARPTSNHRLRGLRRERRPMGDQLLPGSEPRGPVDAQRGDSDAVMAVCGHPTTRVDRTLDDLELAVVAAPPHE